MSLCVAFHCSEMPYQVDSYCKVALNSNSNQFPTPHPKSTKLPPKSTVFAHQICRICTPTPTIPLSQMLRSVEQAPPTQTKHDKHRSPHAHQSARRARDSHHPLSFKSRLRPLPALFYIALIGALSVEFQWLLLANSSEHFHIALFGAASVQMKFLSGHHTTSG
jgi:hypothetical protein